MGALFYKKIVFNGNSLLTRLDHARLSRAGSFNYEKCMDLGRSLTSGLSQPLAVSTRHQVLTINPY
jgi:hypothetical protein